MNDKREGYISVKKAGDRFHTKIAWLDGNHSFSFGSHYDATNTHHGLLLVNNEDWIKPASGFNTHPHQDMEIVTWMLEGELEHKDSLGNAGVIYPGLAQRMSAGTGIYHSEMNASRGKAAHLVQMCVSWCQACHTDMIREGCPYGRPDTKVAKVDRPEMP